MQTAKGIPEKEKIQCGESRTCHHDLWLKLQVLHNLPSCVARFLHILSDCRLPKSLPHDILPVQTHGRCVSCLV